jgi:hypothetical protein
MKPIYTEQPPGYEVEGKVCLLFKVIYGLKQSGQVWYQSVHKFFIDNGFSVSKADPAVFYHHSNESHLIMGIHVDDPLSIGSNLVELLEMEESFRESFRY